MKLYVMRHGPAEDVAPTGRDADRALTPSGRERVRDVAKLLSAEKEEPLVILSSPLVRALQTAEIVANVTKLDERAASDDAALSGTVEVRGEMAPGRDAMALVHELVSRGKRRVMIVGHEPDLSMLVADLVGDVLPEGMLKAMVVGIKLTSKAAFDGADPVEGRAFDPHLLFVLQPKKLVVARAPRA